MITIDPVCNRLVDTDDSVHEQVLNGKTYYFCSEKCKQIFNETCNTYCLWRSKPAGRKKYKSAK
ncbi:MAG: YHS domain-containing protein [Promethearchaeota archaeon]